MNTDEQRLDWVVEHLASLRVPICNSIVMTYINKDGYHKEVSIDDCGEDLKVVFRRLIDQVFLD